MSYPEIIQQWQFLGKVHPSLMEDDIFERCKEYKITSLQSYLLWSEVEKEEGKFDFTVYDELIEKIKKHNLKWVPFIIFGPNYATPEWFKKSENSVFARCLEHNKDSRIQSIWNPNLPRYAERFLSKVAERYKDSGILESVTFGISGNWGEALYPVTGGFYGNFHSHLGFWAGDKYAREDFLRYCKEKGIKADIPELKDRKNIFSLLVSLSGNLPDWLKGFLKTVLRKMKSGTFLTSDESALPENKDENWTHFIKWYLGSMNKWADLWLQTARKYFPDDKLYLVTGGTGHPATGGDLVNQTKIAAKYKAGIRITNQTNDYSQSFILTRLVASAAKLYNTYFITEEAAVLQSLEGVTMRIFDAVSTGADGLYCKNFISIAGDPIVKKFLPAGTATGAKESLLKNIHYFKKERPVVKIAVLFPNNSIYKNPGLIIDLYNKCSDIRDLTDFDLLDETMIKDGGLNNYQYVLVLSEEIENKEISEKIEEWEKKGGKLIRNPGLIKELDNTDGVKDGIYATEFENRILLYNSNNSKSVKKIKSLNREIEIEGNSIVDIPLNS